MNERAAEIGMVFDEIDTPCLIVDLDAMERNIATMARFAAARGVRLRAHAKTHKSPEIARLQIAAGATGLCCQKVGEAEALVRGGVSDVLVSNQVVSPKKLRRLAALAREARILVCVDDAGNVAEIGGAAREAGSTIECLVEIDVGAGRCGVAPGTPAVALAKVVAQTGGLRFAGLQAYHGGAQHLRTFEERRAAIEAATAMVRETLEALTAEGLTCDIVGGAGTGTFEFESASGVYNELQCGSYVFMDADYGRILKADGQPLDAFENSLFILTGIMSKTRPGRAVCDAGLKASSVDSGLPTIFGEPDLDYLNASDEHGVIADPNDRLKLGDRLKLVPGHCDPTVNMHDWLVGVRGNRVEALWPVAARGRLL